jgi:hypothetical protein
LAVAESVADEPAQIVVAAGETPRIGAGVGVVDAVAFCKPEISVEVKARFQMP